MAKKPKGGKPKKPKLSKEEQAKAQAEAVDDIENEDYKKQLRMECRMLEKCIKREEDQAGLYQDERQRVNYFWIVAKKDLEDKQAELRNKERELQDLVEKHQIEIKVYQQRVKHLLFQNLDQLTELKYDAEVTLKNQEDEHRINQREAKADIRSLKVQQKEQQIRHQDYLRALRKQNNAQATAIRHEHERIANEIKMKFNHKMMNLRKEMEEKRKKIITQIEDKKNARIKELTIQHAGKYADIRTYYQDITSTNLDIIKSLKEDLADAKKEDQSKLKQLLDQEAENRKVVNPLKKADEDIQMLKEQKREYDKEINLLKKYKKRIRKMTDEYKDIEWNYEVKLQQYQYLEREKKNLFDKFQQTIYEIHQKTGLKNLILEKQLETIQESIETKEAQLNELLSASNIDPDQLKDIKSTLEESENLKNEAIKEIQQELKKIREAHSNMVKTYEGKLSEFGIPVEELGFDPLVPANL